MKFCYRGIAYEKQIPSLEITEKEINGKYRGTYWHSRRLTKPCPERFLVARLSLKYRGRNYQAATTQLATNSSNHSQNEAGKSPPLPITY